MFGLCDSENCSYINSKAENFKHVRSWFLCAPVRQFIVNNLMYCNIRTKYGMWIWPISLLHVQSLIRVPILCVALLCPYTVNCVWYDWHYLVMSAPLSCQCRVTDRFVISATTGGVVTMSLSPPATFIHPSDMTDKAAVVADNCKRTVCKYKK